MNLSLSLTHTHTHTHTVQNSARIYAMKERNYLKPLICNMFNFIPTSWKVDIVAYLHHVRTVTSKHVHAITQQ
jgi:hypothetical protein